MLTLEMSEFPSTRHSVLEAARLADPAKRREALSAIVSAYWKPAYKYVRFRWRRDPEDAADLIQSFFTRTLEQSLFSEYDPTRSAFRTWLRTCLDHFVANEAKSAGRQKRGGGSEHLSLEAERELAGIEPPDPQSIDDFFHREWIRRLFEISVQQLEATSQPVHFALFSRYDLSETPVTYQSLAVEFNLPVSTVTNHLAAMRRRFRQTVLDTLRSITADDREFRAEAQALFGKPPC
jgi:RNA polymerase sigma factor (sigma-70 family)